MKIFLEKFRDAIHGIVEGFDRLIFKGQLTSLFPQGAFGRYLSKRGVLLKDAGKFFEAETEQPARCFCVRRRFSAKKQGLLQGRACSSR